MTVRSFRLTPGFTVDLDNSLPLRHSHLEASVKLDVDFAYNAGVLARCQRQDVSVLYS
jgi:hypothetical protein